MISLVFSLFTFSHTLALSLSLSLSLTLFSLSFSPLSLFFCLFSAADAYCLLDVYLMLSKDPKAFGLPEDLRSISSSQPAKSDQEKKLKHKNKQSTGQRVSQSVSQPNQNTQCTLL